jgi:hypothetical protein
MTRALYHVGFPSCAALVGAAFPFRLRDLRRASWRHVALRAICMSFWIYRRVEDLLGVPAAERTPGAPIVRAISTDQQSQPQAVPRSDG